VSRLERRPALMAIAQIMAQRSSCTRHQVGAVIAREGRILSSGYNGTPAGMPHCDHTCTCPPFVDLSGGRAHWDNCPAVQPCQLSTHAEANAIVFAARYGTGVDRASLYTTTAPCLACAQLIISAGIADVYYERPYRNTDGLDLLRDAAMPVLKL
jgi:dCMP deaminase